MPYYVYESLDAEKERFEFKQSIHDASYSVHPENGRPIKRIIVPGVAVRIKGLRRSAVVNKLSPAATACGCASNAALARKMYANSRQTPVYEALNATQKAKNLKTRGACSHGHGAHRCGHKHPSRHTSEM